eukprot:CFRG1731T1
MSLFSGFDAASSKHVQSIFKEDSPSFNGLNGCGSDFNSMQFAVPPVGQPSDLLKQWTNDSNGEMKVKIAHGTTTLAFKFKEGVIVCVDSRATGGQAIGSQTVKKVIEINPYLLGTMAGGAADCSFWERQLAQQCRLFELRNKERISVRAASKLLGNMVYQYRSMGLSMGTMITGWDKSGPGLFYVDSDGTRLAGDLFSVGSGSTYAYGVLDTEYDYELDTKDAIEVGRRAIFQATHRDAYSGGQVNVYHVKETGWENIGGFNVLDLYYEYEDLRARKYPRWCHNER